MTLNDIALLIPSNYRKEILETNMITHAVAVAADTGMHYLFTVWKNYVEQSEDLKMDCGFCLERVLKNYREILPVLVELEKQSNLLKEI